MQSQRQKKLAGIGQQIENVWFRKNNTLWRPVFISAFYIIVLWREFNCVKIPQSEANKSTNRWGNLRAKGGVYIVPLFGRDWE
jgi:hypothetical protein